MVWRIEKARGARDHQPRRFQVGICAGDRELNALIFPNGPREDHPLIRVAAGAFEEPPRVANAFRGDQDSLGIQTVQQIAESLSLLAHEILDRHFQIVEKQFRRGVVHHGADGANLSPWPTASRRSTRMVERPSVLFFTWSAGVVRASSSIKSECSAREIQIFCPLIT